MSLSHWPIFSGWGKTNVPSARDAVLPCSTADWRDRHGTARSQGTIYTATSGTLTFLAGESTERIEVSVLDDAHDKGEETLMLSSASSGRLTDGETTATIENRDPLPRAPLARFGRTSAVHVVVHVEERC